MHLFIYEIIILCLMPFALAKILYRGLMNPAQLKYLNERFAFYSKDKKALWESRQTIWFHCVSVGETKAIFNLIEILLKQYPKTYFLISHGTLTGRETRLPESPRIQRAYLPYDTSGGVKRFLSYYRPNIGLILETELWFNLINQCKLNKVPLHLINARLSENSLNKYLPFKKFINTRLLQLDSIHVRAREDANNFSSLTEAKIRIMGNIKFDSKAPKDTKEKSIKLKKKLKITDQFVVVVGSTRPGEEQWLIRKILGFKESYFRGKINYDELILIIVPRHPERFDEVEKVFQRHAIEVTRISKLGDLKQTPSYILGDTMGDLYEIYGIADLAIIGGSILNYGGQNPIEPMSLGIKTAVGGSIYNFSDMVNEAEKHEAILRFDVEVGSTGKYVSLEDILKNQLFDENQFNDRTCVINAKQFIKNSSGSTKKIIELVSQYL
jgi:3-deoxy-D-manno-octulosonic-acid transferase